MNGVSGVVVLLFAVAGSSDDLVVNAISSFFLNSEVNLALAAICCNDEVATVE